MRVISHTRIVETQGKHPRCADALDVWYRVMKRGTFRHFAELKQAFRSVDKVGPHFVFNISGNALRLIAAVHFNTGMVFVRCILTHAEYDKGAWQRRERLH